MNLLSFAISESNTQSNRWTDDINSLKQRVLRLPAPINGHKQCDHLVTVIWPNFNSNMEHHKPFHKTTPLLWPLPPTEYTKHEYHYLDPWPLLPGTSPPSNLIVNVLLLNTCHVNCFTSPSFTLTFCTLSICFWHTYVGTYVYKYIHTHTHAHTNIHTCMHTHMHAYTHTCTHTYSRRQNKVPNSVRRTAVTR